MRENDSTADGQVSCAVNKGVEFQHLVTLDEAGVQKGAVVEQLMNELLGPGWLMNNLVVNVCGKDLPPQALRGGRVCRFDRK